MLDLLMEQEDKKISYKELKRGAQSWVGWRHRQWNLPSRREHRKNYECDETLTVLLRRPRCP